MLKQVLVGAAAVGLVTVTLCGGASRPAPPPELTVYKSPSCRCCQKWVEHMAANGFKVTSKDQDDLTALKADLGVPKSLTSCHTALVAGYVIEGHVPATDVQRLLRERPKILGLSAPGMPGAGPGMDTSKDPYEVVAFDAKGTTTVFAKH